MRLTLEKWAHCCRRIKTCNSTDWKTAITKSTIVSSEASHYQRLGLNSQEYSSTRRTSSWDRGRLTYRDATLTVCINRWLKLVCVWLVDSFDCWVQKVMAHEHHVSKCQLWWYADMITTYSVDSHKFQQIRFRTTGSCKDCKSIIVRALSKIQRKRRRFSIQSLSTASEANLFIWTPL